VRMIITDANDHAPTFVGTPYSVNVSEVTVVGTVLISSSIIRAIDEDQPGTFSTIEYHVEPGPFSHLAKFDNPFIGNLILTAPLDYETLPKFWLTIRAQDQGDPPNSATTTVTINIIDADDQNPRFQDDKYIAYLPENNRAGERLNVTPRALRAVDPDAAVNSPIELSLSSPTGDGRETSYFSIEPKLGDIRLKKPLPGHISLPLTLLVRATQVDNRDRYALTTVTVLSRRQQRPLRFLQNNQSLTLLENFPVGHIALILRTTRDLKSSSDSQLQFQLLNRESVPFEVTSNGEVFVRKELDFETKQSYLLPVRVTDGQQSDLTYLNITVLDVNDHDPQFTENNYNLVVREDQLNMSEVEIGTIQAFDGDTKDSVTLSVKGPFSNLFTIDNHGILRIRDVRRITSPQNHLIIVATDSGSPPRSSSVSATVQFPAAFFRSKERNGGQDTDEQASHSSLPPLLSENNNNIDGRSREASRDDFVTRRDRKQQELSKEIDVNALLGASSSSAIVLVIVLGVLLATLFIIIITLTVHVLKQRKFSGSPSSSSTPSSGSASPTNPYTQYFQQRPSFSPSKSTIEEERNSDVTSAFNPPIVPGMGSRGVENPIFSLTSSAPNGVGGNPNLGPPSNLNSRYFSDVRVAGNGGVRSPTSDAESGVMSDSSSQERPPAEAAEDELVDIRSSRLSPPPPPPPVPSSVTCTTIGPGGSVSSGSGNSSRVSVVKWPQGSIPRRVKKLTWEDEIPPPSSHPHHHHHHPHNENLEAEKTTQQEEVSIQSQSNITTCRSHTLGSHVSPQSSDLTVGLKSSASTGLASVSASSPVPRFGGERERVGVNDSTITTATNSFGHVTNGLSDLTVYF